jgi:hypothetical protein
MMDNWKVTNQGVAIFAIALACLMTFGAFILSRDDSALKLMSLQSVLTLGGTLMGVAGTLLVGIQNYKQLSAGDVPPGSSLKSSTSETTELRTPTSSASTITETSSPVPKAP